jgi:hypothetical protein
VNRRMFLRVMALGAAAFEMPPVLSAALPTTRPWQPADPSFVFDPSKQYGNFYRLAELYSEAVEQELRGIIISDMRDWVPPRYRRLVRIWTVYPNTKSWDPCDHRWGVCWKYKLED